MVKYKGPGGSPEGAAKARKYIKEYMDNGRMLKALREAEDDEPVFDEDDLKELMVKPEPVIEPVKVEVPKEDYKQLYENLQKEVQEIKQTIKKPEPIKEEVKEEKLKPAPHPWNAIRRQQLISRLRR